MPQTPPQSGPTTPPSFTRLFDGQCFADKIFVLAPPFQPSPKAVAEISQRCGNSIAVDTANGDMAVPSGAQVGALSIGIYHPPYNDASIPAVKFTPKRLDHPRGSAWDGRGNLWIADDLAGRVWEFRPPFTESTQIAAESAVGTEPAGMSIDKRAKLMFVSDLGGNFTCAKTSCHVFVIREPYTTHPIATLTYPHEMPFAVGVDPQGRLFVALDTGETTGRVDVYTPPFSSGEKPAFSLDPGGQSRTLAFDSRGNLFSQLLQTGGVVEFDAPIDGSKTRPAAEIGCPQGSTCERRNWAGLAFGP
ncbi:MAG TPA: hypothetical protein VFE36_15080 [Candidatus Baltobacteraceae bacterium]|nr:hypothetical protein [Candidatus Baltobacteraceae bacterium]